MNAKEFRKAAENGEIQLHTHEEKLRIAFLWAWDGLFFDSVTQIVDKLHKHEWSFGKGGLKFNRTLDAFYLAQINAGIYIITDENDGEIDIDEEDFDGFYARHHKLLNQDAWRQYYSLDFLMNPTSALFYRLPDLQDLPDSCEPLGMPRDEELMGLTGHFTKLTRWAQNVRRTMNRQPTLSTESIAQIALSTLQKTVSQQVEKCPHVQPFSETQARFWLKYWRVYEDRKRAEYIWGSNAFCVSTARGDTNVWAWEAHYSKSLWDSSINATYAEPDLDGTGGREVHGYGWPDGGVGPQACVRGWEPEVGSEEEIAFLAEVAIKETEGVELSQLDYSIRSHILLAVLHVAFQTGTEREKQKEDLKQKFIDGGRIDEDKVEGWIKQALVIMEPYVSEWKCFQSWPNDEEDRSTLLRQILVENGQLFARWSFYTLHKEFVFYLGPGRYE